MANSLNDFTEATQKKKIVRVRSIRKGVSIDRYTEERVHDGITLESTSQSFNDSRYHKKKKEEEKGSVSLLWASLHLPTPSGPRLVSLR